MLKWIIVGLAGLIGFFRSLKPDWDAAIIENAKRSGIGTGGYSKLAILKFTVNKKENLKKYAVSALIFAVVAFVAFSLYTRFTKRK